MDADGLPPMTPDQRKAFARLTHAAAHEALMLRTLRQRMQREGVTTVEQVHALIAELLCGKARLLGLTPDTVCDAYEAASTDQAMDLALLHGRVGHA